MLANDQGAFGNRHEFALELALRADPDGDDCAPVSSVGSWGEWSLWVGGQNLCQHRLFLPDGNIVQRNSVTWYLAPLIRWLAVNWDPLLHEERLPIDRRSSVERIREGRSARDAYLNVLKTVASDDNFDFAPWQAWASRHSLRWAAEGGLMPDIFIRRLGDDIEVAWGNRLQPGGDAMQPALEPGVAVAPVDAVGKALDQALRWFVEQPSLATFSWISELREAVAARTRQEVQMARLAWHIDGAAKAGNLTKIFLNAWKFTHQKAEDLFSSSSPLFIRELSPSVAMFGALSPNISSEAATKLLATTLSRMKQSGKQSAVEQFAREEPAWRARSAWQDGYALADEFAEDAELDFTGNKVNLGGLLKRLGIESHYEYLGAEGPRGVALAGQGITPTIVINTDHHMNSSEAGSRFTQAHELCHILFDRNHARRVSHASTPWAPAMVEQRANAFAAMLLMPRDLVRRLISAAPENLTLNDIQGAASAMCVSLRALINHMANMGDMPDESRERLMDELEGFYLQPAQGPRIM